MYQESQQSNRIPSVSEVCRALNRVLDQNFHNVLIQGEISEFTNYRGSGHWYFTLKDAAAQLRCAMFARDNARVGFEPRVGDKIAVMGSMTVYDKNGSLQCVVRAMRRAGAGELYERFLQLKNKLFQAGLFREEIKREIPAVPRRIGIVTGLQTAALRDVLARLTARAPYADIIVYPTRVQGIGVENEIAEALRTASARGEADVLLLVRGGGSIEDLWAFNEEIVAYAIRECRIPVITGIGHESDITIADLTADLRAPTPTAAAEMAAAERGALINHIASLEGAIQSFMRHYLENQQMSVDFNARAFTSPEAMTESFALRLERASERLSSGCRMLLSSDVSRWKSMCGRLSLAKRSIRSDELSELTVRMQRSADFLLQRSAVKLTSLEAECDAMNPKRVLSRGYAWVQTEGRLVSSVGELKAGDAVDICLADGNAHARIESLHRIKES